VYLRLGVEAGAQVYPVERPFEIGKGMVLRPGSDVTIVACGLTVVPNALAAAARLARIEIDARVIDMPTLKPIDAELLVRAARETRLVVTVEEHSRIGGLGSAVAEVLAEHAPVPMHLIGLPDEFTKRVCDYPDQLAAAGLDAEGIAASVRGAWLERSGQ
jgi:transketolase